MVEGGSGAARLLRTVKHAHATGAHSVLPAAALRLWRLYCVPLSAGGSVPAICAPVNAQSSAGQARPILFCKDFPSESSCIGWGGPVEGGMAVVRYWLLGRRWTKEQTASLQTALLRNDYMRGPRYKPPERALFEVRRSAARMITGAGWMLANRIAGLFSRSV